MVPVSTSNARKLGTSRGLAGLLERACADVRANAESLARVMIGSMRSYSGVPAPDDVNGVNGVNEGDGSPGGFQSTFRASDVTFTGSLQHLRDSRRHAYVQHTLLDQFRRENGGSLGFGTFFSDHMLSVSYDDALGWSRPEIRQLDAVRIHPAAQVLHYGMSCFEGMKVYRDLTGGEGRGTDTKLVFFRPERNLARFVNSARRLHLPSSFCTSELLELLKELVRADAGWVPGRRGEALYLRPVLYAISDMLGVSPPESAVMNVIMSPSGDYFGNASKRAIRLFIEEGYARAWVGGAGDAKVGGNYAPTIYPQWLARERYGVDQVVYTREGEFEECGAMNIFFVFENGGPDSSLELATPSLGHGTILPGVTRESILDIARAWAARGEAVTVRERGVGVEEVAALARAGRLREVFACGTASVIQPVGALVRLVGDEIVEIVPRDVSFREESLTRRMYDTLVDIQHGVCTDARFADWTVEV